MRGKGDIAKAILKGILWSGAFAVAAVGSPTFTYRILPKLIKYSAYRMRGKKKDRVKFYNTFYYLKNRGLIETKYKGRQIYISLSKEGRKLAEKYQIDDLKIAKPKKWDGRWRILIFDIEDKHKVKREALRGKIKELGMYKYQKSVWICPYDFQKEVDLLRNFFGFREGELKIITASNIDEENKIKRHFNLA